MCHFLLSFMFYGGYDSCMSQLMMGVICKHIKHGPPRQRTCLFEVCWAQGAVQPWLCGDEYQQHLGKKYGFGPWGPGGGSWGDVYICFRGNDHGSDRCLVINFARFAGRLHILHTSNPMKLTFSGAQIDEIWLTHVMRNLQLFATKLVIFRGASMPGYPGGSVVGFAPDKQGRPLFSFSSMSSHTQAPWAPWWRKGLPGWCLLVTPHLRCLQDYSISLLSLDSVCEMMWNLDAHN